MVNMQVHHFLDLGSFAGGGGGGGILMGPLPPTPFACVRVVMSHEAPSKAYYQQAIVTLNKYTWMRLVGTGVCLSKQGNSSRRA